MIKPLEEVIAFKDPYAIKRFCTTHKIEQAEAELIFEDVMRYLWLSAVMDEKRKEDPSVPDISIAEGMYIIDEMWHEFVILTRMYHSFCEEHFGKYMHHPPLVDKLMANQETMSPEEASEIFLSELIQTVIEYFGEAVAIRWFDDYHKYLPNNYAELIAHHVD